MGLGNDTTRFTYVNIKKGQLVIKKGDQTEVFNYVEGVLTGLDIREDEYQGNKYKKLCLTMTDKNESYQLQMKMESGYCRAFCNMIENVNLTMPFKIEPKMEEVGDKKNTKVFISQGGTNLKWKYTKDNPGELPLLEKITFKGKEAWDNTNQQAYYTDMLLNKIKPMLQHSILAGPAHQLDEVPNASDITEPIDDLPF